MVNQIRNILDGWCNDFLNEFDLLSVDKKRLISDRLNICDICETRNGKLCDKSKGGCGCQIKKKASAKNSRCPLEKW